MTQSTSAVIDTPIATIQRTTADLVEVRFKAGATLSVAGITAILSARQESASGTPMRVLIVFAADEMDFDMAMITKDHYSSIPVQQFTRAVAWVTRNDHNERFCQLYFAYYPSPVPSAIFSTEEEARTWLEGK
jgi:hypothetical protein